MMALPDVLKDWKESAATIQVIARVKWTEDVPTSARTSKGMIEPTKELPSRTFLTLVILQPKSRDEDGAQDDNERKTARKT